MHKLCARCGIIFNTEESSQKFCSGKCEKLFQESSLSYVKRGTTPPRRTYAP